MYNTEQLEKILLKYPNKNDYHWDILTQRVSLQFIEKYKDMFPWKWGELSKNINVDMDFINKYPNIKKGLIERNNDRPAYYSGWEWDEITNLPKITMDDIETNMDLPWCYDNICSLKPNLTMEFIKSHPEIEWYWGDIITNPGISIDDIKNNMDMIKYENSECYLEEIGTNYNINMDIVNKNDIYGDGNKDGFKWNWIDIAKHPFIKIEEHLEYILDKMRTYNSDVLNDELSDDDDDNDGNDSVNSKNDIVISDDNNNNNKIKEWKLWVPIFKNRNITIEFIEENIDMLRKCLKYDSELLYSFVLNDNVINDKFLEKHFELLFGDNEHDDDIWLEIVQHKGISLKFIEDHKDCYEVGYIISNSSNITVEYIEKNIDLINFNWGVISMNEFGFTYKGLEDMLTLHKSTLVE